MNINKNNQQELLKDISTNNTTKKKHFNNIIFECVYIILFAIILMIILDMPHIIANDYIGVYNCNECGYSSVKWTNNCSNCGSINDDNCLVQVKPHCELCGKKTNNFSHTYCTKCGGFLLRNERIPIYTINNKLVKWCVKHI